jgi:Uma2 family endonuclease
MHLSEQPVSMTVGEYLEWEPRQSARHEYRHGRVYSMAGGTKVHGAIAFNAAVALGPRLRGTGCRGFSSDVKIAVSPQGPFYYADVVITCDPREDPTDAIVRYPSVVIEVLSRSTGGFDRTFKFWDYALIPSLSEYVLVDSQEQGVIVNRRAGEYLWSIRRCAAEDSVVLESLGIAFAVAELYEGVTL